MYVFLTHDSVMPEGRVRSSYYMGIQYIYLVLSGIITVLNKCYLYNDGKAHFRHDVQSKPQLTVLYLLPRTSQLFFFFFCIIISEIIIGPTPRFS